MSEPLRGLCSKATAVVLADLARFVAERPGPGVVFESDGGVEVSRRVREGEAADLLVLADDEVRALADDGIVLTDTVHPLFDSDVVLAVAATDPRPALDDVGDLAAVLRGADAVGYSTGPSGRAFLAWLDDAGLGAEVGPRLVQAPPGVPVARLVADGTCDVGIQQRSEMDGAPGVQVVGPLPGAAAITSTFTGAVLAASGRPDDAARVLEALGAAEHDDVVEAQGLHPARR